MSDTQNENFNVGLCLVGPNLNITVVRGFAPLDVLASVSRADYFNQITNREAGVQREETVKHSREALDYALNALEVDPVDSARAFPEIILNLRDASAVEFLEPSTGAHLDVTELQERRPTVVELRFEPQDSQEQVRISRVDGNHRLGQVTSAPSGTEFPYVPFAMFLGLTNSQEQSLFRDLNGRGKPMASNLIKELDRQLVTEEQKLSDVLGKANGWCTWIYESLTTDGGAWHKLDYVGGPKRTFKEHGQEAPPLTNVRLIDSVFQSLTAKHKASYMVMPPEGDFDTVQLFEDRKAKATAFSALLGMYWQAVRNVFSTEWQDKKNYILFATIGWVAFSKLGGDIIDEVVQEKGDEITVKDFEVHLKAIKAKADLTKNKWAGIAGGSGSTKVYDYLLNIHEQSDKQTVSVIDRFGNTASKVDLEQ